MPHPAAATRFGGHPIPAGGSPAVSLSAVRRSSRCSLARVDAGARCLALPGAARSTTVSGARPRRGRSRARACGRRVPRARPTARCAAVGALGRVLHAWEQWDAAHEAYARRAGARAARVRVALPRCRRPAAAGAACRGRDAASATRSRSRPDYLPARVKLAEALLEAGRARREPAAVRGARRETRPRSPRRSSASDASRRRGPARRRPSRTSSARSRCFRSSAPRTTRSRCRTRALGRRDEAQRGARAPRAVRRALAGASTIPCSRAVAALRDDAGAQAAARRQARRRAAISTGAIAAHEAALARDPSLAQAHANLISLYGRAAQLGEGRGALPRRRRARRQPGRRALRLRRAARPAGEVGRGRRGVSPGARGQPAARAGAQQPRPDPRAPAASSRPRSSSTGRRSRASRRSGSRASTSGACCWRSDGPTRRSPSSRSSTEPRDAEAPRYLFALVGRPRPGRPQGRRRQVGDRGEAPGARSTASTSWRGDRTRSRRAD